MAEAGFDDLFCFELIELGVDPARLEVQAFGESRPIVADDKSVSRRKSRRVVFSAKQ